MSEILNVKVINVVETDEGKSMDLKFGDLFLVKGFKLITKPTVVFPKDFKADTEEIKEYLKEVIVDACEKG